MIVYIEVEWETDGEVVEDLPTIIKMPSHIEINNEAVCEYLSDTYGWLVLDWRPYVPK